MNKHEDDISLKRLFFAMWRRKWLILSSIIVFGLLSVYLAYKVTPVYKSGGSFLVYKTQSKFSALNLEENGGTLGGLLSSTYGVGLGTTVGNELQFLHSRRFSLIIADSLLKKRTMSNGREFPVIYKNYPSDSVLTSRDEVASRLRGRLTFEKAGAKNDVIKIYYESPSAVAAGQVVDITLHVFNRLSNRRNQASANTAAFFLSKEIRRIKDSLQTAENRLEKFRDNHKSNIKLANLKRNVKINEELYETITKQYVETTIWERSQFGLGRIIDKGYTPNGPSKPNRSLYILFGLIFGGVLGVGYVFLGFVFLDTINGKEKMANIDAPLLAVIPDMDAYIKENYERKETVKIKEKPISTRLITLLDPDSAISESFRQLEDNLIYARDGSRMKSIVITSSVQGEGKTKTTANLGVVLAEAGHDVLVVDANFRRPHLHNIFGASETGGITKVLAGDLKLHDAIKSTPVPNLSLLPAGQPPGNVAATARSQSFLDLLRELEDHFDFVLIDTAPYGDVTDAAPVLKQADGAVVIAKFGHTKEKEVSEIVDKIHQLNATVLGTVLNAYNYTKSNDLSPASRYYKNKK